jgi:acyl-CoA thioester hydrolase
MDNDAYQHVNNVVYYSYFDTAVNQFLISRGVLDIHRDSVVGLVVDTGCSYFSSISFPDTANVGVRVAKLGNSSVRYEVALFRNDETKPAAAGHFVHVYVDRESQRPVPIPDAVRAVLATIAVAAG